MNAEEVIGLQVSAIDLEANSENWELKTEN